jgi:hypothetical protein
MPGRAARNAGAVRNQIAGNAEIKPAHRTDSTAQTTPKEQLNFPVLGWYALPPEDGEELPPEVAMKKPAKSRA